VDSRGHDLKDKDGMNSKLGGKRLVAVFRRNGGLDHLNLDGKRSVQDPSGCHSNEEGRMAIGGIVKAG
jgi:hypothetical protein